MDEEKSITSFAASFALGAPIACVLSRPILPWNRRCLHLRSIAPTLAFFKGIVIFRGLIVSGVIDSEIIKDERSGRQRGEFLFLALLRLVSPPDRRPRYLLQGMPEHPSCHPSARGCKGDPAIVGDFKGRQGPDGIDKGLVLI